MFFLLLFIFLGLTPADVSASTTSGTIDVSYKYAWSNQVGWINFGCDNCNVTVTDSAITGYAWSENFGWVNLAPSTSGITNDSEGDLGGYAWGEQLGWINFANVSINSSGIFSGTATGDIIGTLTFNCDNCNVKTDWRPYSIRTPNNNSGGGSGVSFSGPTPPVSGFNIEIKSSAVNENTVLLNLNGGPDARRMIISTHPYFRGASQEPYTTEKIFTLCKATVCPEGAYNIYVQFFTEDNIASPRQSTSVFFEEFLKTLDEKKAIQAPNSSRALFNINLQIGKKNADVLRLQKTLNALGFVLTDNGPGSQGNETNYFGVLTRAAVIRFQEYYTDSILKPLSLVKGTGYFGLSTREQINKLCSADTVCYE